MHGTNLENKALYALFCQVEEQPVSQSYQSFMMINTKSKTNTPEEHKKMYEYFAQHIDKT